MEGLALTLRQALEALWRQRLIVLAALIIALLAAGARLYVQKEQYAATATAQLATSIPAGAANTTENGQNGSGTSAEAPDLAAITSSVVASEAATLLGRPGQGGQLAAHVTSSYDSIGNTISVTASAGSSADAIQQASAFAQAYANFRKQQRANGIAAIQKTLSSIATELSATKTGDPLRAALTTQQTALYSQLVDLNATPQSPVSSVQKPSFASVVDAASKPKTILIALAIGLIAGVGLALLRDQLDTSIRSPEAAEELAGSPVIAQLPYVRKYRRGTASLAVIGEPHGRFAGAVRELRTSAGVLLAASETPVVVVTSAVPNEGKSLVTANLAVSWALAGKQTILVGGDLRRPQIQRFFTKGDATTGLSDLLRHDGRDRTAVERALLPTDVEGLWFLPAGSRRGDPGDALASPRMAPTIAALRKLADVVIIDSPPVMASSDASIMARYADGVVLIVRAGRTSSKEVTETMKRLRVSRANVIGLALNRLKHVVGDSYRDYYQARDVRSPEPPAEASGAPEPQSEAAWQAESEAAASERPTRGERSRRVGS